ncbi:conserved serine-rich protein [Aspergillus nomiae NRRL 13137]|uniref:Conserved serine-rich protein n=1 Tax=Aspergillus nomiae NRRL (strain ATCC 15546 / NRRL 13137 / CBS 260.88 / M93) TaxID=1509407 RepID=A0A0L1J5T5_ASPN3|nr:conserved serine-rich protein [Aspergillus nomiae NRRL 13137]KNG87104.1 conserved serine-rich protein [Aspergillus nomiae NRRL 13137]
MVFIRLIVKVYPREQLSRPFPTPKRKPTEPETKPASFLLAIPNPEAITLGQLAGLIRSKWTKLRPNAEPLDIKKLLDDSRDTVDLDVDMTVADVWVNQARARRNEDDQVGTVRVVQRPAPYAPVRFPSVDQDWGVGREEKFTGKFETIEEARESETETETETESESEEEEEEEESEIDKKKAKLINAKAVVVGGEDDGESETDESEEEESGDESESGSEEDEDEGESEEPAADNDVRMEDSLPETRVLKRKMSPEELEPKKQPRLQQSSQATEADGDNVNGTPVSSPLGTRKRNADRAPSFSGLGRRLSFTERPALSHGLGLGITKSPPRKKQFLMADLSKDSTQSESVPKDASSAPVIRRSSVDQHPSTPAKLQTPADKVRLLQSALRKDSPVERSPERRSVSFAEGEDYAIPTSVHATKSTLQATNKHQKNGTSSSSKPAPPEPEERSDGEEDQSEEEFSTAINTEINEYEKELQANDLDPKSEYTRKLKWASKKWQIMKNNENSNRKRQRERFSNAHNDLKALHREVIELKEFNKPPSQRPKSQTPNGTPGTRKLSRDPTSSQNRKSEAHWDVEIVTPRPNSKKLIPKSLPSSQISRKSPEREQAQGQRHWSVEIPTPKADSTPEIRPEPKKPSQERPPSPLSESESEQSESEEEESTPKQPEPKKPSSEKPPSSPAESVSEEDSSSEEEGDDAAPNQPDPLTKSSPAVEVSVPAPVPEPGSDSEEQSGSDEEEEEEEEDAEEMAEKEEEKDKSTAEESQNEDNNKPEKEGETVQAPKPQENDIVPETEEEREQETTTPTAPNPAPTETPSKPDPAAEETDSDTDESESDEESDKESDKENQTLPKPTPTTKANILRRTSLNPPSSQPNPPSSSQPQPSSTQSTPTASRPARNTLKTLLFQQRAEQAQARLKKEEEAAKRKSQPHKDIFSGPSDTESEDEDESESESESDSGADAGDILSTGSVGKLRTALPRK